MSSSRTIRYLRYPVRAMKFSLWMVTFVGHTLYYLLFGALEGQGPGAGSQRGAIPANARPASPLEECVVCRDEPNFFPRGPPTAACSHNSEVCFVCLRRTVDEAITSGRYTGDGTQIQCPSVNCGSHMGRDEISDWASPEVFQRYNQAMLTSAFINNTLYVPCLNCQAGQIHEGGDDEPIVRCHACGALQCFRHRVPWHSGLSCKEWEKKNKDYKRNDKLSKKIILSSTKPCPKCGRRVSTIPLSTHTRP
ncbi:hypothetical protein FS842_003534 [Serendipita sp. 407]|nr:hypothetical protein FS842_003534 [Serendipita sp. 407]